MQSDDAAAKRCRELSEWFAQPLGHSLQTVEMQRLNSLWPRLYATVAVQLGSFSQDNLLNQCLAPTRIVLDLPGVSGNLPLARAQGQLHELPFETRSVDVALLPHTLEFSNYPHEILREVYRVLAPEGHVVILGFNPFSLWGLWRLVAQRAGHVPWSGRFIQLPRVKDWLRLLDFELVQGHMLYYRPPLHSEALMARLQFMDKMGDRWWPLAAAVYLLVAKKRVVGMTPLRPAWRTPQMLGNTVVRPVAKLLHKVVNG